MLFAGKTCWCTTSLFGLPGRVFSPLILFGLADGGSTGFASAASVLAITAAAAWLPFLSSLNIFITGMSVFSESRLPFAKAAVVRLRVGSILQLIAADRFPPLSSTCQRSGLAGFFGASLGAIWATRKRDDSHGVAVQS
jgi:hypothetical protein